MNFLFIILSIAYIAGIFLLANSSLVSDLSTFNPYSILHIPLYGILTALLILSIAPMKLRINRSDDSRNLSRLSRSESVRGEMRSLFHRDPTNPSNPINSKIHFLLPGGIALIIAIADEIYQGYIPTRESSITDVLLDLVGITLVLFFAFYLFKRQKFLKTQQTQSPQ